MPLLVVCFSCQREGESQAAGLPGETVPEVSVMTVRSTQVPVTANLPGRMEAYLQAEVRARVTGIIQERCYQEGQTVQPGDLLFKIDPAPLQAVLDECKAAVARARAVLSDAEDKAARYSSLVAKGAVSIREHKQARAEEERARAEYAAAAASLEQARLNLEYTRVEAPISGRVRRALVTEGAFANQNEFTHLTTIEQIDPIYVRFSQPASQYSSLRRAVVSGLWKGVPLGEIKVRLLLSNGEEYPHSGRIIFPTWRWTRIRILLKCGPCSPTRTMNCCPALMCAWYLTGRCGITSSPFPGMPSSAPRRALPSLSWARKECWKRAPSGRIR